MYAIIELQTNETTTAEANTFETRPEAEAYFYTVLAKAAASEARIHSAVMLTAEGYLVKSECFDRTPLNNPAEGVIEQEV